VTARFEVAPPPTPAALRIGPVALPTPRRTAYYLGLGTLAAVELIEWPVALAVAAGSYVADQAVAGRRDRGRRPTGRASSRPGRRPATRSGAREAAGATGTRVPAQTGPRGLWRRILQVDPGSGPSRGASRNRAGTTTRRATAAGHAGSAAGRAGSAGSVRAAAGGSR